MRRIVLALLSGLCFAVTTSIPASAEPSITARPSPRDPYGEHIAEAAQRFGLPAAWIRAVMHAESDGDPHATSSKGAMGLMQIMPETWAGLRDRYRLGVDPYDPHDNIIAGAAYIRDLFDRYGSPGWIAAYNAGPGRYESSLKGSSLPVETRVYAAAVTSAIDGSGASGTAVIMAAEPLTWTRAPLFIVQQDRRPAADPVSAGRTQNDAALTPTVRDVSAIVPQSGGLFVIHASEGIVR